MSEKRQYDDVDKSDHVKKIDNKKIDTFDFETQILNQIVVETEPITRLPTSILRSSKPLLAIAESFKNNPECKKYDYCIIVLGADDISPNVWNIVTKLHDNIYLTTPNLDMNAIDDLLYILHKYDIRLTPVMQLDLEKFIYNSISIDNTIFKRMTCLESNQTYYPIVIKCIQDIYKSSSVSNGIAVKITKKLSHQMWLDLLIKTIK